VRPELENWCARRGIALWRRDWCDACQAAGLARDAVYLMRPDTYVALAARDAGPAELDAYFAQRGIVPA